MRVPDPAILDHDPCFSVSSSNLVFGPGATREVGDHAAELGLERVLVVTDPRLRDSAAVVTALDSLREAGLEAELFSDIAVEPTDASFRRAAAVASEGGFDGFVAVGGGSAMDTAKAANLYATYPADFLAYVNPPIGAGTPPPGPLKPLIAIPTTAGTGSETTGVAIFDLPSLHAKTGIAHRRLRPTLGIVDPLNTHTMPRHGHRGGRLRRPVARPGVLHRDPVVDTAAAVATVDAARRTRAANPFSDIWAELAIAMVARSLPRAVEHPDDEEARAEMSLAATYAGIGFGNAGVHLPHGMSYAVSGGVREFRPAGYPQDHAMVPHGMSVVLNAPGGVPVHRGRGPGASPAGGGADGRGRARRRPGGCGHDPGRRDHRAHAPHRDAQRPGGRGLHRGGRPDAGRGHHSPAPGHQAVTPARRPRGSGGAVPGRAALLVTGCVQGGSGRPAHGIGRVVAAGPVALHRPRGMLRDDERRLHVVARGPRHRHRCRGGLARGGAAAAPG